MGVYWSVYAKYRCYNVNKRKAGTSSGSVSTTFLSLLTN